MFEYVDLESHPEIDKRRNLRQAVLEAYYNEGTDWIEDCKLIANTAIYGPQQCLKEKCDRSPCNWNSFTRDFRTRKCFAVTLKSIYELCEIQDRHTKLRVLSWCCLFIKDRSSDPDLRSKIDWYLNE